MAYYSRTFAPVCRTAEIRAMEAAATIPPGTPGLMERAGLAAAHSARKIAGDQGRGIIVVAGPGNNGGDAFVLARHLQSWWFKVSVVFTGDPARLPADAQAAY